MSIITLPSRMQGEVRGITVREGRVITDNTKLEQMQDHLLSSCWVNTLDPGPYQLSPEGKPVWGDVLVGDALYGLIAIREATYPGKPLDIEVRCSNRPVCGKKYVWEVPLEKYLEQKVQRISDADFDHLKSSKGNQFEGEIDGVKFRYRLMTTNDQKRAKANIQAKKVGPKAKRERQNELADTILARLYSINDLRKQDQMFDFLESKPLGFADEMIALITSHDPGLETDIETECPFCGEEVVVSLPLESRFLFPKLTETRTTKKSQPSSDEEENSTT